MSPGQLLKPGGGPTLSMRRGSGLRPEGAQDLSPSAVAAQWQAFVLCSFLRKQKQPLFPNFLKKSLHRKSGAKEATSGDADQTGKDAWSRGAPLGCTQPAAGTHELQLPETSREPSSLSPGEKRGAAPPEPCRPPRQASGQQPQTPPGCHGEGLLTPNPGLGLTS